MESLFTNAAPRIGDIPGIPAFLHYRIWNKLTNVAVTASDDPPHTNHTRFSPKHSDSPMEEVEKVFVDGRALRREFEAIAEPDDVRSFLQHCGHFWSQGRWGWSGNNTVSLADVHLWQEYFDGWKLTRRPGLNFPGAWWDVLIAPPLLQGEFAWSLRMVDVDEPITKSAWDQQLPFRQGEIVDQGKLNAMSHPNRQHKPQHLVALVHCSSALEAIAATIMLDIMAGVQFKACDQCTRIFRLERSDQRFCSRTCKNTNCQRRKRQRDTR